MVNAIIFSVITLAASGTYWYYMVVQWYILVHGTMVHTIVHGTMVEWYILYWYMGQWHMSRMMVSSPSFG